MHSINQRLLPDDCTSRRFVQFQRLSASGFIEFAFGIGSPDLMVDLVMPVQQYEEFCAVNQVVFLTSEEERLLKQEQDKWRYGIADTGQEI